MLENYLPVIVFMVLAILFGLVPILLATLVAPHKPNKQKNSPYECGFEPFEETRVKFDVRFYLVAILFIIFDLEVAFCFPWALAFTKIGAPGFWSMIIFLHVLIIGFIYEWKKGALEWE